MWLPPGLAKPSFGTGPDPKIAVSRLYKTENIQRIPSSNLMGYSNPKVDYLIEQALQQVDDENRRVMLQRATELAMSDLGIMPIHFQFTMWATRKGVSYTPRTDEYTLAFQFKPTPGELARQ